MCGIVGILNLKGESIDLERLSVATRFLERRGPDSEGIWTGASVGFGHRRLAILDLSTSASQPMVRGEWVIVFNGEVYNFGELKKQLEPLDGQSWQSESDTEVVLEAFKKWGTGCVTRFVGMFAFAIWNNNIRQLFVARDRLGIKPLYYYHDSSRFIFASRPRSIVQLMENAVDIDPQALRYYLEAGYIPGEYSIFSKIRKLESAHYLTYDAQGTSIKRYWDFCGIATNQAWNRRSESDLVDELDELVSRSVKYRMISDVPLGAFLSGGIDSSLVVAMMNKYVSSPVKTFTIGFSETSHDESHYAQAVADWLNTEHTAEILTPDALLALLPEFLSQFDEPFFDYAAFPTMALSRMARKQVSVSLSGDGGDELFGGYHYYQLMQDASLFYKSPKFIRSGLACLAARGPGRLQMLGHALQQPSVVAFFAFARSISKGKRVLSDDVMSQTVGLGELFAQKANSFAQGLDVSEVAARLDISYTLPDDYLQKIDLASMTYSLESRDPLLDHTLVEWAAQLPDRYKLRGRQGKYLLRQLAYRYIPKAILDRPKQGFVVPISLWIRGPLKEWADDLIFSRDLYEKVFLDRRLVHALYENHRQGMPGTHSLLWAVLMLLSFAQQHLKELH